MLILIKQQNTTHSNLLHHAHTNLYCAHTHNKPKRENSEFCLAGPRKLLTLYCSKCSFQPLMQGERQPLRGLWRWWAASSRLRWASGTRWQRRSCCPRSLPRAGPGTSRTLTSRQSASCWRSSSECPSGTGPVSPWPNQEEKLSSVILGSENIPLLRFREEAKHTACKWRLFHIFDQCRESHFLHQMWRKNVIPEENL